MKSQTYAKNSAPKEASLLEDIQEAVVHIVEQTAREPLSLPKETPQSSEETVNPQEKATYLEALKWLESIPYFHSKRRDEIAALPMKQVAEYYPGIRQGYEQAISKGKKPKPGWVYDAFMEKWTFETEPELPETPEGKRSRQAKAIYDGMDKLQQAGFWQHMREYAKGCMSEEQIEQLKDNGGIWHSWGPLLMEQLGLLE